MRTERRAVPGFACQETGPETSPPGPPATHRSAQSRLQAGAPPVQRLTCFQPHLTKGDHGDPKALKESLGLPCERAETNWDCLYPSCLPVLQISSRRELRSRLVRGLEHGRSSPSEPRRSDGSAERRHSITSQYAALYRDAATVHGPGARPLTAVEASHEPLLGAPTFLSALGLRTEARWNWNSALRGSGEKTGCKLTP